MKKALIIAMICLAWSCNNDKNDFENEILGKDEVKKMGFLSIDLDITIASSDLTGKLDIPDCDTSAEEAEYLHLTVVDCNTEVQTEYVFHLLELSGGVYLDDFGDYKLPMPVGCITIIEAYLRSTNGILLYVAPSFDEPDSRYDFWTLADNPLPISTQIYEDGIAGIGTDMYCYTQVAVPDPIAEGEFTLDIIADNLKTMLIESDGIATKFSVKSLGLSPNFSLTIPLTDNYRENHPMRSVILNGSATLAGTEIRAETDTYVCARIIFYVGVYEKQIIDEFGVVTSSFTAPYSVVGSHIGLDNDGIFTGADAFVLD